MNLDIHTAVITATILAVAGVFISLWSGISTIRSSHRLPFFRKRRDKMVRGWRLVFFAFGLIVVAFFLTRYAEPVVYHFYPPTATITLTPTLTITPTVTLSPTITLTPTITNTPSVTNTPFIPLSIETGFEGVVTPNPDAVFSTLRFAQKLDQLQPVDPKTEFTIPVGHLYGAFSYNNMIDGSQWTSLWYRDGVLVYYESSPWAGGSGGYGYTDWNPSPDAWLPGNYDVQIFVGTQFKVSSQFIVTGTPIAGSSTTPQETPSGSATPHATLNGTTTTATKVSGTTAPTGRFLITPSLTPYTITPLPTGRFLITPSPTPYTITPLPTGRFIPTATPTP